jgi:hypothetical protein
MNIKLEMKYFKCKQKQQYNTDNDVECLHYTIIEGKT